ncbi:MAG: hypothetical protein KF847_01005 [Pirellulales bacterium]|nr:hypothetical protein [Pirellulales bacterium]
MNLPIVGESLWRLAGWTMIHSLWIGALVAAVGAAVRIALRRAAPGMRYAASLATLAGLSMAPIAVAAWLATHADPASRGVPAPDAHPMASPAGAVVADAANWVPSFAPAPTPSAPPRVIDLKETPLVAGKPTPERNWGTATSEAVTWNDWNETSGAQPAKLPAGGEPVPSAPQPVADGDGEASGAFWHTLLDGAVAYLPWAWLVGAPVTFAWLALGLTGAQRLRRNAVPISDGPIAAAVERIRAALRISRQVAVAASDAIAQPVLVGIVRPLVLLPAAAVTGWGPEDLELALVHELAHVRRWDNAVNLAQRVAESCLWFHPAVWLASRQMRRDREECCDAIVVGLTGRPVEYADLLVTLAAKRHAPGARTPRLAAVSAMANHPLASRVRRILNVERESMRVSRSTVCVVGAALAATAAGIVTLTAASQKAIAVEGQAQTAVAQPAAQERYTQATVLEPKARTKEIRTTLPDGADERQLLEDIESQGFPCRIEDGVRKDGDGRKWLVRTLSATVPAELDAKFVFESRQEKNGTRISTRVVGKLILPPPNQQWPLLQPSDRYEPARAGDPTRYTDPNPAWPAPATAWPSSAPQSTATPATGDEARLEAAIVDLEKRLLECRLEQSRDLARLKSADRRLEAVEQALQADAELKSLRSRISFVQRAISDDEMAALRTGEDKHVDRMQKLKQQLAELQAELNAKRSVAIEQAERTFIERMEGRRDELTNEHVGVQNILTEELAAKKKELARIRSGDGRSATPTNRQASTRWNSWPATPAQATSNAPQLLAPTPTEPAAAAAAEAPRFPQYDTGQQPATSTAAPVATAPYVSGDLPPETLRYDGQTFEQWRTKWRYELKTEKRIDAIEAMAAFGRAGKGREAAEAILDVAGEYDFTTWGGDGAGKLKGRIIDLLTAEGDTQLPVNDWLPALVERYRGDAKKWGKLTDALVCQLRHVDPQSQAPLLEWARDRKAPLRRSALTALAASSSDQGRALLDEMLVGDEADEAILALVLFTTPVGSYGLGGGGMAGSGMLLTDPNLDALMTGLTHPNEKVQRHARQLMGATNVQERRTVVDRVLQELARDNEPRKQVALMRALGGKGSREAADDRKLAESLRRVGEESDSIDVQVAAVTAICRLDGFERGVDRMQVGVEMLADWNAELKADEARELILEELKAAYTPDSTAPEGGGGFF